MCGHKSRDRSISPLLCEWKRRRRPVVRFHFSHKSLLGRIPVNALSITALHERVRYDCAMAEPLTRTCDPTFVVIKNFEMGPLSLSLTAHASRAKRPAGSGIAETYSRTLRRSWRKLSSAPYHRPTGATIALTLGYCLFTRDTIWL
jgi:hypothetical protein